jgi:Transposase DDE domain group 1
VAEFTGLLDLTGWPPGMRVIARKERPHPGAQLRLTDADGNRVTCFATGTRRGQLADLELRHRRRARCEDRIRCAKDTGLRNLPLRGFDQNQLWCELVAIATDLLAWAQLLALDGPGRRWEPKKLRFRLLATAGRLTRGAAACGSASTPHGPGRPTSRPHSPAWPASPPADRSHPAPPTRKGQHTRDPWNPAARSDNRASRPARSPGIQAGPQAQAANPRSRKICECRTSASGGSAARFGAGDRGVTHERSGRPDGRAFASTCPLWLPAPAWPTWLA